MEFPIQAAATVVPCLDKQKIVDNLLDRFDAFLKALNAESTGTVCLNPQTCFFRRDSTSTKFARGDNGGHMPAQHFY